MILNGILHIIVFIFFFYSLRFLKSYSPKCQLWRNDGSLSEKVCASTYCRENVWRAAVSDFIWFERVSHEKRTRRTSTGGGVFEWSARKLRRLRKTKTTWRDATVRTTWPVQWHDTTDARPLPLLRWWLSWRRRRRAFGEQRESVMRRHPSVRWLARGRRRRPAVRERHGRRPVAASRGSITSYLDRCSRRCQRAPRVLSKGWRCYVQLSKPPNFVKNKYKSLLIEN